jgi:hypothetical protein
MHCLGQTKVDLLYKGHKLFLCQHSSSMLRHSFLPSRHPFLYICPSLLLTLIQVFVVQAGEDVTEYIVL